MNKLYPLVEKVLKEYTDSALLELLYQIVSDGGYTGTLFGCSVDLEYVLKRFIGACLAKDPEVKFNSYVGLMAVARKMLEVDSKALGEYVVALTDYRKHCGGKKTEMESYAIGRLLVIKALKKYFEGDLSVMESVVGMMADFVCFEEQILEVAFLIVTDKKTRIVFIKAGPTTKAGAMFHKILCSKLKKNHLYISPNYINYALAYISKYYPKKSLCLSTLGPELHIIIPNVAEYFSQRLAPYLKSYDSDDLKPLFYILYLMQFHLKSHVITLDNHTKMVNTDMLKAWLYQLRVKNKRMKGIVQNMQLTVEANAYLAFSLLHNFHYEKLYLYNISRKHPLAQLYKNVDAKRYWQYLYEKITNDVEDMENYESEDDNRPEYFVGMEFILKERYEELGEEEIGRTVALMVAKYHEKKEESLLHLIWNLLNFINMDKRSKVVQFNTKGVLILNKIDIDKLNIPENLAALIKKSVIHIRKQVKVDKQYSNKTKISLRNFSLSVIFYSLIYPYEIEVFDELKLIYKDLNILLFDNPIYDIPKKKVKKHTPYIESDPKHPIHVVIDIFISLLTKAPQFLRQTIYTLFQCLIPQLYQSDLSQLLYIILKPDHYYIYYI